MYKENDHNFTGVAPQSQGWFAPTWVMDQSKLSEQDKEVIAAVNFPKQLASHKCIGKRMAKYESNDTWHYKRSLELGDIVYLTFTKTIGASLMARDTPNGKNQQQLDASKKFIEKGHRSKPNKQVYIDGHAIQAELDWLLLNYSNPKPTPSMKAEPVTDNVADKVSPPKKAAKKKTGTPKKATLTAANKKKIDELAEAGDSAKDIAKKVNKFNTTIIEYLKSKNS